MIAESLDCKIPVKSRVAKQNTVWINALTKPFSTHGVFYDENEGRYLRIKSDFAAGFDDVFARVNTHTAGGRLRFRTDSPYIAIYAKQNNNIQLNVMPLCGQSGFDLYKQEKYCGTFLPKTNVKNGFSDIIETDGELHDYTINFPVFDNVNELFIGLSKNACVLPATSYKNEGKPVVFYGSSITQGVGVSRPGNAFPALVCRSLGLDYINLGLASRCKGEAAMAQYISALEMSAFVMGFDHNAENADELNNRHYAFYKTVRESNKDLPIILLSAPDISYKQGFEKRREVIIYTYEKAKANSENVFFIDGKELLGERAFDCTVDNIHPNDLGYYIIAKKITGFIMKNNIL